MADSKPPTASSSAKSSQAPSTPAEQPSKVQPPARPRNPALRMLGLPALPRKLPSRNWTIFLTVTTAITGAIIYDRREKKRAIARWSHAVSHLAKEPLPGHNPNALPRKLTIYLSAPPGDGLRYAQDHFAEYIRPILAASGLDWEFVQGRQQGDIRAVVAEKLRRVRREWDKDLGRGQEAGQEDPEKVPTSDEIVEAIRQKNGTPEYIGVKGDIVVGRNTWKEYIRGIHEGWLGPLSLPADPIPEEKPEEKTTISGESGEDTAKTEETNAEEAKPKRPLQLRPHNTVEDYPASPLPLLIPAEFNPTTPLPLPHILGFGNTPTRMVRFFNRRALADNIGREVAAVCFSTYREFRELPEAQASSRTGEELQYEQQLALQSEERDWIKSVWKAPAEEKKDAGEEGSSSSVEADVKKELIWPKPIVLDSRIATRMRRFELQPEDEARARAYVVPEEEIEGWIKGSVRSLIRWGISTVSGGQKKSVPVYDDE